MEQQWSWILNIILGACMLYIAWQKSPSEKASNTADAMSKFEDAAKKAADRAEKEANRAEEYAKEVKILKASLEIAAEQNAANINRMDDMEAKLQGLAQENALYRDWSRRLCEQLRKAHKVPVKMVVTKKLAIPKTLE